MRLLNSYEAMQPEGQFFYAFLNALFWATACDGKIFADVSLTGQTRLSGE
jgi:hypothetical protein